MKVFIKKMPDRKETECFYSSGQIEGSLMIKRFSLEGLEEGKWVDWTIWFPWFVQLTGKDSPNLRFVVPEAVKENFVTRLRPLNSLDSVYVHSMQFIPPKEYEMSRVLKEAVQLNPSLFDQAWSRYLLILILLATLTILLTGFRRKVGLKFFAGFLFGFGFFNWSSRRALNSAEIWMAFF